MAICTCIGYITHTYLTIIVKYIIESYLLYALFRDGEERWRMAAEVDDKCVI